MNYNIGKKLLSERFCLKFKLWLMAAILISGLGMTSCSNDDDDVVVPTFFPDLLFREEKICIELDGGYHWGRIRQDTYRDETFAKHGFTTIRIKNLDTCVNVCFWQRLVEGLENINNRSPFVDTLIIELHKMIDTEIQLWTCI